MDHKNKEFEDDYLVISIDSTEIKITNRGSWMRKKGIFENSHSSRCEDQENTLYKGNR
jgi:hypothetical protein